MTTDWDSARLVPQVYKEVLDKNFSYYFSLFHLKRIKEVAFDKTYEKNAIKFCQIVLFCSKTAISNGFFFKLCVPEDRTNVKSENSYLLTVLLAIPPNKLPRNMV